MIHIYAHRIITNTLINHEGSGCYNTRKDYISGFYIYLSQNADKSVQETHEVLMAGTQEVWHV